MTAAKYRNELSTLTSHLKDATLLSFIQWYKIGINKKEINVVVTGSEFDFHKLPRSKSPLVDTDLMFLGTQSHLEGIQVG